METKYGVATPILAAGHKAGFADLKLLEVCFLHTIKGLQVPQSWAFCQSVRGLEDLQKLTWLNWWPLLHRG